MLSDAFWRRRFGGDPRIVGGTISLDDVEGGQGAYEVLGVMPPNFSYPVNVTRPTDIWVPYVVPSDQLIRNLQTRSNYLQVIARLKPRATLHLIHGGAGVSLVRRPGGAERDPPRVTARGRTRIDLEPTR